MSSNELVRYRKSLERYQAELEGQFDDLDQYLSAWDLHEFEDLPDDEVQFFLDHSRQQSALAQELLALPQKAAHRRLQSLSGPSRFLVLLEMRRQVLIAARALNVALDAASVPGMSYRKAGHYMFAAAQPLLDPPSLEDVLWLKLRS